METKNKKILEALQMQPLSQEEMMARHILGRLYGPIATCVESTRNGRLYNKSLWEKALEDEIFLEKVATKALFLELGHPADREETDMKQACACIPEVPKIVGDDLYAYVDILDTPNGRLLKTLIDYGFIPGISSRGSGDVMDNNQVDPETFFLETWDIVQLPAVRNARLTVCESLDSDSIKLKKALAESYKAAKEEDRDTMKKALENLNIDIDNELTTESTAEVKESTEESTKVLTAEDIPWAPDEDEILTEETAEETESEETDEPTNESSDESSEELDTETSEDAADDVEDESDITTIKDFIKLLKEYDSGSTKMEFDNIIIDGKEYTVDGIESSIDEEKDTLIIGVNCRDSEETSDDADKDIETETEDGEISVTVPEGAEEDSTTADDDGDVEVIESLKEMVRQKEALETEVNSLRKAKTVGDAKESELQEKLTRYRTAFKNTSAEAAKVPELQSKVKELTEKLAQSEKTNKTLIEQVKNARQLKESVDNNKHNVARLNEEVSRLTKHSSTLETKLASQTKVYTEKLQERTNLAKSYKARFIETLNRYIESKANMLGVQSSEITSRLNENYTLADVDAVCDQILDTTVNFSRLPFSGRTKTSARIAESISSSTFSNSKVDPDYGYEIDDSLLELAGLKK